MELRTGCCFGKENEIEGLPQGGRRMQKWDLARDSHLDGFADLEKLSMIRSGFLRISHFQDPTLRDAGKAAEP